MSTEQIMQEADASLLKIYNRFPIALAKGEGVYLYDAEGKSYLDFGAGIAVMSLGYGHPRYQEALKSQVDCLIHTSNLFYHEQGAKAAKHLVDATGLDHVFFTNSGAEAVEGALKLAKKFANLKGKEDYEIIAMEHSFHGRTLGALSVTGNEKYRSPFEPLIPNVKFATFNDLSSVEALVSEKTAAIIMETIQGEGGIYPAEKAFIEGVAALCQKYDALLILDEIQCGMGRSGYMYAYQAYGVKPDILVTAKALGCGVPVGAFVCTDRGASMTPGDHGTTYGGNPLACAAVNAVFEIYKDEKVLEHVNEVAPYLWEKLEKIKERYDCVQDHRGMGMIQGLQFTVPSGEVVRAGLEEGLVTIGAGNNTVRFVPPLVISKADVDEMVVRLCKALDCLEK